MKKYLLLTVIMIATPTTLAFNNKTDVKCQVSECKIAAPEPLDILSKKSTYRLNIKINKSYRNTKVYLNDGALPEKTDENGNLKHTEPWRTGGEHCIRIKNKSFQFNLNANILLNCTGTEMFCCVIKKD